MSLKLRKHPFFLEKEEEEEEEEANYSAASLTASNIHPEVESAAMFMASFFSKQIEFFFRMKLVMFSFAMSFFTTFG